MIATASLCLTALLCQNQQVRVGLQGLPSTVRLGEVIVAKLVVETRQRPQPPVFPKVDGVRIVVGTPVTSRSVSIIRGRMTSSYSFNYPVEFRPSKLGAFTIGPIEVKIGDRVYATKARQLTVVKEVTGKDFGSITIVPSRQRVYVHEPVRFDIECAVDQRLTLSQARAQDGTPYYVVMLEAEWLSEMAGAEILVEPETTVRNGQDQQRHQ